jgi:hypothetical protein
MNGAVPCAECAREDRHGGDGHPHVRRLIRRAGMEAIRVCAPLEDADVLARDVRWNDRCVRGDDHVGAPAQGVAPPPHRLYEQQAIEQRLCRARMIDDRCVDFQDCNRAELGRRSDRFTAEVVVPLDDGVGLEIIRQLPDCTGPRESQVRTPERRRHRHPPHAGWARRAGAGRDECCHLMPERGKSLRHRRDVYRPPLGSRDGLVDR